MRTPKWQGRMYVQWLKAYLECLFEQRDVVVLERHRMQLELSLERP